MMCNSLGLLAASILLTASSVSNHLVIDTNSGTIQGQRQHAPNGKPVDIWWGIPYAEPPVGDLRFRPPKPVRRWVHTSTMRTVVNNTGWPKSKFLILNGCNSETKHFWPCFVKAKMRLRGGSFFQFSKICLHFSAVCLQFFKKTATSQTHFGFITWGQKCLVLKL